MAGCHSRLQAFLRTRLVKVPVERLIPRVVSLQQQGSVTSFSRGFQQSYCVQNDCKYWPLQSNLWKRDFSSLRFLHTSSRVYSEDRNAGLTKETEGSSSSVDSKKSDSTGASVGDKEQSVQEEKLSVFQRFKKTYKEHGKVLVGVHLITSTVWFGSFFYAAKVGVDVIPFMEWLGLSEKIISPFRNSSLGDVALAYLMYKLATPARYTMTLAGTNYAIKYLRKKGVMQPVDKNSSLRSLARDSRKQLRQKQAEVRKKTNQFETKIKQKRAEVVSKTDELESRLKQRRATVIRKTSEFETKFKERRLKMKDRLLKFRSKLKEKRFTPLGSRKSKKK